MWKVVTESTIGKYKVLKLDKEIPLKPHKQYRIDGRTYDAVPIFDAPNCIAIISSDNFNEKNVEFL